MEEKSAFVSERQIKDNLLIAHEVFHVFKKKKRPRKNIVVVKLDWNKAYNRLEWVFLKSGHLVMACITLTSFQVRINGRTETRLYRGGALGFCPPTCSFLCAKTLS